MKRSPQELRATADAVKRSPEILDMLARGGEMEEVSLPNGDTEIRMTLNSKRFRFNPMTGEPLDVERKS